MTAFTESLNGLEIVGPDLDDGEVVTDVLIISRVMRADMEASILFRHASRGMDAIVELGLLNAAHLLAQSQYTEADNE